MDRKKVIKEYEDYVNSYISLITSHDYELEMHKAVLALIKEQETASLYKCPNCGTWVSAENVVRCKDCEWYDERISMCDNCGLPREQTFFCADGKRR